MSWEKVKLGDIATVTSSKRFHLSERSESGIPFYCSKQIIQKVRGELVSDYDYIREEFYENVKKQYGVPEPGDLLITTRGSYGVPYIYQEDDKFYFADGNLTWLKDFKEDVDVRFLYYWIRSYEGQKKIDAIAKGTAQKAVTIDGIKNLEISIPSFKTQKHIADILSAYDNLIENNQKQIKLLEEAAGRLYKQWFIDLRYPGHETTPIVDGLPEGWRYKPVNSIVSLLSGYAFKSDSFSENGRYKIVTIKNVQDGVFDGENVSLVDDIPPKMPTHCILNNGDVLLSLTGNVGRVCMVVGENYLLNQRVAKLKSDFPSFTYCVFRSKDMYDEMNNLANGAAQQNLSPIRTGQIKIAVPPRDILELFEKEVNPIIAKILLLNKQNKSLSQSRDRLLPKLMNGNPEV